MEDKYEVGCEMENKKINSILDSIIMELINLHELRNSLRELSSKFDSYTNDESIETPVENKQPITLKDKLLAIQDYINNENYQLRKIQRHLNDLI